MLSLVTECVLVLRHQGLRNHWSFLVCQPKLTVPSCRLGNVGSALTGRETYNGAVTTAVVGDNTKTIPSSVSLADLMGVWYPKIIRQISPYRTVNPFHFEGQTCMQSIYA